MGDLAGPVQQAKLVLLGDMGAGKSSLVLRFVKGQFFDYQVGTHKTLPSVWAEAARLAIGMCLKWQRRCPQQLPCCQFPPRDTKYCHLLPFRLRGQRPWYCLAPCASMHHLLAWTCLLVIL